MRGIVVSYQTIRRYGRKRGLDYVRRLRRKQPSKDDGWHLDEVAVYNKAGNACCSAPSTKAARRLLTGF